MNDDEQFSILVRGVHCALSFSSVKFGMISDPVERELDEEGRSILDGPEERVSSESEEVYRVRWASVCSVRNTETSSVSFFISSVFLTNLFANKEE